MIWSVGHGCLSWGPAGRRDGRVELAGPVRARGSHPGRRRQPGDASTQAPDMGTTAGILCVGRRFSFHLRLELSALRTSLRAIVIPEGAGFFRRRFRRVSGPGFDPLFVLTDRGLRRGVFHQRARPHSGHHHLGRTLEQQPHTIHLESHSRRHHHKVERGRETLNQIKTQTDR